MQDNTAARDEVLGRIRAAVKRRPFDPPAAPAALLPVTALADGADLLARFTAEVERVKGEVHLAATPADALEQLADLLQAKHAKGAVMWDALPVDGVGELLEKLDVKRLADDNAGAEAAEVGITGCQAAAAATGTLVLASGAGRSRMASLLPPYHVALVKRSQLTPRLEDWVVAQRATDAQLFRDASNVTLITGRSRTADIEMIPVFGVHGPLELHVIVIESL